MRHAGIEPVSMFQIWGVQREDGTATRELEVSSHGGEGWERCCFDADGAGRLAAALIEAADEVDRWVANDGK
jgi:hypothetical protein